jgi:hypothetical protein
MPAGVYHSKKLGGSCTAADPLNSAAGHILALGYQLHQRTGSVIGLSLRDPVLVSSGSAASATLRGVLPRPASYLRPVGLEAIPG